MRENKDLEKEEGEETAKEIRTGAELVFRAIVKLFVLSGGRLSKMDTEIRLGGSILKIDINVSTREADKK